MATWRAGSIDIALQKKPSETSENSAQTNIRTVDDEIWERELERELERVENRVFKDRKAASLGIGPMAVSVGLEPDASIN